jgi:hypothetical protein
MEPEKHRNAIIAHIWLGIISCALKNDLVVKKGSIKSPKTTYVYSKHKVLGR